jgi:hypothetical protein
MLYNTVKPRAATQRQAQRREQRRCSAEERSTLTDQRLSRPLQRRVRRAGTQDLLDDGAAESALRRRPFPARPVQEPEPRKRRAKARRPATGRATAPHPSGLLAAGQSWPKIQRRSRRA